LEVLYFVEGSTFKGNGVHLVHLVPLKFKVWLSLSCRDSRGSGSPVPADLDSRLRGNDAQFRFPAQEMHLSAVRGLLATASCSEDSLKSAWLMTCVVHY